MERTLELMNKGLRRRQCPEVCVASRRKELRSKGLPYVNSKMKDIPGKAFTVIENCCRSSCYRKLDPATQEHLYTVFYQSASKQAQDIFLSSLMTKVGLSVKRPNSTDNPLRDRWKYHLKVNNVSLHVCRKFISKLYSIGFKRLRIIQRKKVEGDRSDFPENRGKHKNRPHSLKADVIPLFFEHLNLIPSETSPHSLLNQKYFENPTLTVLKLYELFSEYYKSRSGQPVKLAYKTYFRMFRNKSPISLKPLKMNHCDDCSPYRMTKNPAVANKLQKDSHTAQYKEYLDKKHRILEAAKRNELFCIEFDYAADVTFPRLDVTEQFYRQLLWFYMFNVHFHNTSESNIYTFMEGHGRKDASSVASYIFHAVTPQFEERKFNEWVFFSNVCGGHNKNRTLLMFCLWLSKVQLVVIYHIFPVCGRSSSQCDRNFSPILKLMKKICRCVDVRDYLEIIAQARKHPSPHAVLYDPTIHEAWDDCLTELFLEDPIPVDHDVPFKIQSYVQLKFDGNFIYASRSYDEDSYDKFAFWKPVVLETENLYRCVELSPVIPAGVSESKKNDIETLFKYLTSEEIEHLQNQCNF